MSTKKEAFAKAIVETKKMAKDKGKLCYIYDNPGVGNFKFKISFQNWSDWIFRAYPGGRTELSKEGADLAKELGMIE